MQKCDALVSLPQIQKQLVTKDPISTEEKKFKAKLYKMRKRGLISDEFYKKVIPCGSQPARFYGLAKVQKRHSVETYSVNARFSLPQIVLGNSRVAKEAT